MSRFHSIALQLSGKKDVVPRHEGGEVSWRCSGVNDVTCADGSRCMSPVLAFRGSVRGSPRDLTAVSLASPIPCS